MNMFVGDYKTFKKFFDGYARNKTRDLTQKYKSGICACCGTKEKEIQSAHKRGFERKDLVRKFFEESTCSKEGEICHVDLDKFEESFVNFSKNLANFHFLCEECHRKYDDSKIDESFFVYKAESIKNAKERTHTTKTASIKNVHESTALDKKYFLHGCECSGKEFEKHLRDTSICTVFVALFYTNKSATQHVWQVNNFKPNSSLNGNLHSGYLRNWRVKGITGIKLEIK